MPVTLTEEYISLRLTEAIEAADPSQDGYSEIGLSDGKHLKCAAVLIPLLRGTRAMAPALHPPHGPGRIAQGQVSFPGGACDEGDDHS